MDNARQPASYRNQFTKRVYRGRWSLVRATCQHSAHWLLGQVLKSGRGVALTVTEEPYNSRFVYRVTDRARRLLLELGATPVSFGSDQWLRLFPRVPVQRTSRG